MYVILFECYVQLDVRYVIHYTMPSSMLHFYQESGRAGRDGLPSTCILYYDWKDKDGIINMVSKSSNYNNNAHKLSAGASSKVRRL